MTRRPAVVGLVAAVVVALGAACGVDVPDDVAAEVASSTTVAAAPPTTATPRSDDELEQALIDNGYTLEEARCGARNLREQLDEDEIRSIIDAATIDDISLDAAQDFADALRPCVQGGTSQDDDPGGSTGPDGGGSGGGGGSSEVDPGDGIGRRMPGSGDDDDGGGG